MRDSWGVTLGDPLGDTQWRMPWGIPLGDTLGHTLVDARGDTLLGESPGGFPGVPSRAKGMVSCKRSNPETAQDIPDTTLQHHQHGPTATIPRPGALEIIMVRGSSCIIWRKPAYIQTA